MLNNCEGCHRYYVEKCLLMTTDIKLKCPCSICILKVMCTKECDERFETFNNLTSEYRDYLSNKRHIEHFLK
jgi:hypothetical protein